ncbi:transglycosylase SLT domain-containing protein [Candidatus Sororendozoicomonas aggregata]|uniref:transglycosylase SLT domain-containing protein n=1 Tax=Candidatus Sororendozoicomonas aggregata TaxID=3073239 RepID=UPI002ED373E4
MTYRLLRMAVLAITTVGLPPISTAATDLNTLESQRRLFLQVESKLKKKDSRLYESNYQKLKSYPLYPYLTALVLSNQLSTLSQRDIDKFVTSWPALPSSERLQRQWLDYLAAKERWADYLTAFERSDIYSAKYQCLNGVALYKHKKQSAAWQQASHLWMVGHSQNKACDPLFAAWKKAGKLTQTKLFDRFWLAAEKGNINLARYIDKSITHQRLKRHTKLFWKIRNDPKQLSQTGQLNNALKRHRFIYRYGLKRLGRRDIEKASRLWLDNRDKYPFTLAEISDIDQWLAIRLAKNFNKNASHYIARIDPLLSYPEVTEWRIRLALTDQNWEDVLQYITLLPPEFAEKSRWQYWQAVASTAIAPISNKKQVLHSPAFSDVRQERGFYGFLVSDMSDTPFQLNHQTIARKSRELQKLMSEFESVSRIQEWVHHKRYYHARLEINRLKPSLNPEQRRLIAYLAQRWDWHHQAIMTAAREALWDDLELRFPSPLSDMFTQYARNHDIDPSWAMAIARQESAFNASAQSHAGAKGLMQLMPATAKQTARQNRIRYQRESDLFKPGVNIALGTAHLSQLIDQFDGNKVFATAAYNAGASRVNRWLKARGHLPLDIWIETIPFDETRQYVKNVLAFRVIYNSMENKPTRMLSAPEASQISISSLSPRLLPFSHPLLTQREE